MREKLETLQLGSRLIELLIETAYIHAPVTQSADSPPDIRPAFRHTFQAAPKNPRLGLDSSLFLFNS